MSHGETVSNRPRCKTCGKPIYATPEETKYGGGWVHVRSNAERCGAPHRTIAEPATLADLDRLRATRAG